MQKENDKINKKNKIISDNKEIKTNDENNNTKSTNNHKTNKKSIQEELIYFKNDILKDIKNIETKLSEKYDLQNKGFEKKLENIQSNENSLNEKLSNLSENFLKDNINKEKIEILEQFRLKANETLFSQEYKIKNIDKELHEALTKYDKIILDNILYPGMIGKNSKFQTFRELIDFLLVNVTRLINYKEKKELEKKENQNKINFQKLAEFSVSNNTELIKKLIKENEKKTTNKIDNLNRQLNDFNEKYKIFEDKINNLNNEIASIIRENYEELYMKVNNVSNNFEIIQNKYNEYVNDINLMKQELNTIKLILIDMISKGNINSQMFRKRFSMIKTFNRNLNISDLSKIYFNSLNNPNINNNIDNNNNINDKKNDKTSKYNYHMYNANSIVKQYIDGVIKIDDINKHEKLLQHESSIPENINNNNEKQIFNKMNNNNKEEDLKYNKRKNSYILPENKKINELENSENVDSNNDPYTIFNNEENYFKEVNNLLFHNHNPVNELNISQNANFGNYNNNNNFNTIEKDYSKRKMKNENNNMNNSKDIFIINSIKNLKKDFNENKIKMLLKNKNEQTNQTKTPQPSKKRISNLSFPLKIINLDDKNKSISLDKKSNFELNLREKIKQSQINNDNNKIINNQSNKLIKPKKENNNLINNKINLGKYKDKEINKYNKVEINFDDEIIIQKKEDEKLKNNIEQIKEFLPKDEKTIFVERMEKLGFTKDKNHNGKNRSSAGNIKNIKKYQINSINRSSDFIK